MKEERGCLCLKDKTVAGCYDQTWEEGRSRKRGHRRHKDRCDVQMHTDKHTYKAAWLHLKSWTRFHKHKYRKLSKSNIYADPLLVLSVVWGHGVLPSSSPLGRSLEKETQVNHFTRHVRFMCRREDSAFSVCADEILKYKTFPCCQFWAWFIIRGMCNEKKKRFPQNLDSCYCVCASHLLRPHRQQSLRHHPVRCETPWRPLLLPNLQEGEPLPTPWTPESPVTNRKIYRGWRLQTKVTPRAIHGTWKGGEKTKAEKGNGALCTVYFDYLLSLVFQVLSCRCKTQKKHFEIVWIFDAGVCGYFIFINFKKIFFVYS